MDDGWFRWIISGIVAAYTAVTGALIGLILRDRDKVARLSERVRVLEVIIDALRETTEEARESRRLINQKLDQLLMQKGFTR